MVDETAWDKAQEAERLQHNMEQKQAIEHYRKSYAQYFAHLGIDTDLSGRCIAEIGPADVPGLFYCVGTEKSFVVEPMPSDILPNLGVKVRKAKAENVDYSKVDEVWRQLGAPGTAAGVRFDALDAIDVTGWTVRKGDALFPRPQS